MPSTYRQFSGNRRPTRLSTSQSRARRFRSIGRYHSPQEVLGWMTNSNTFRANISRLRSRMSASAARRRSARVRRRADIFRRIIGGGRRRLNMRRRLAHLVANRRGMPGSVSRHIAGYV